MFAELSSFADLIERPGEAFRDVLVVVLIATAVLVVLHLVITLVARRDADAKRRWNLWEKLVYLGLVGSVCLLAITSFGGVLRFGALHGWLLFAHMCGAGAFVGVLPLVAVTWCEPSRLGRGRANAEGQFPTPRFFWFPKLMFWIVLASGLVVTMTMLLSMLPIFGTDGLHELLDIHRYSGLLVVVAVALHFYTVLLQRFGMR